jgi:HD-GYP domain-containing protein (c-di-GMP phosphodiesterase class II)
MDRLASLMHDLGKIGVRDDVLLKADRLTPEERSRIQRHPLLAAEILRPMQGTADIAEIVLAHHECPDGSGYPRGLRGDQIPLEARILRVADVFSALTDARVYKPGMDSSQAIDRMLEMSRTKLDAEAMQALRSVLREPESDRSPGLTI